MRYKLLTLCILTCAVGVFALFSQASVPQNMNVQGRLTDSAGDPLGPLTFVFTFKIFDMEVDGTEIWPAGPGEIQSVSTDENGLWNAILGEVIGLSPDVFADTSRWLEFTVYNGVDPPETLTRIKLSMSPYTGRAASSKVADNGVPVGAVIDWWRPNAGFPVPIGFLICDGSMVVDPESPLNGETLPDLRNMFVRGANAISDIGVTSGANTHGHSLTVNSSSHTHGVDPANLGTTSSGSHVHSVDPPNTSSTAVNLAHNHFHDHTPTSLSINSDAHLHTHNHPTIGTGFSGEHENKILGILDANHNNVRDHLHSVNLPSITGSSDTHNHTGSVNLSNISASTSLGTHAHSVDISSFGAASNGNHNHTVDIPNTTSSSTAHDHTGSSGSGDNVPAYAALLKIMRIK